MVRRLSRRTRLAVSFVASAIGGYSIARTDDSRARLEREVLSYVVGILGTMVGYTLATVVRGK